MVKRKVTNNGIHFVSCYNFSIEFWSYFDNVVIFAFHLILLMEFNIIFYFSLHSGLLPLTYLIRFEYMIYETFVRWLLILVSLTTCYSIF